MAVKLLDREPENVPSYGVFGRADFLEEFRYRYTQGQHVMFFGPTGRGKTTLAGQMLAVTHPYTPRKPRHDGPRGLITIQLGPDTALDHLGRPVASWPPTAFGTWFSSYDERPIIRRFQPLPKRPEDFGGIRAQAHRILRWMFSQYEWSLFVPDLQVISDPRMMGLGAEVDQLIITKRKHGSSIWMDAQAPRWVPRSAGDQVSHIFMWRNRDEDTLRRLKSIAGLNLNFLSDLLKGIGYYDCVWVDALNDEVFVVEGK